MYPTHFKKSLKGRAFWPDTKAKNDAYAEKNNLPKFKNLLLPRTTGFNFILEECKRTGIDVLYDITALYQDKIPQAKVEFSFNLIFE